MVSKKYSTSNFSVFGANEKISGELFFKITQSIVQLIKNYQISLIALHPLITAAWFSICMRGTNQADTQDTDHRGDSGLNDIQKQECSSRQCDT